jgi:hypothetical protein
MLQKQREEQIKYDLLPTLGGLFRPEGGKFGCVGKQVIFIFQMVFRLKIKKQFLRLCELGK